MKIHLIIFLTIATQHQFASANACDSNLEDEKRWGISTNKEILDTGFIIPKKIKYTSQCIESKQFNTKCKNKGEFQDIYIFDEDGKIITKITSVDKEEISRSEYKYGSDSKYPIGILSGNGEKLTIERNSEDFPIRINGEKTTLSRVLGEKDGYLIVNHEPIIMPAITFPGLIKFYKDGIVTKVKRYNKKEDFGIDSICRRYEDKEWNDIIDESTKIDGISKLINRTARHKNGYTVFHLSNRSYTEDSPTYTGTSFKYSKFDEYANWTSRERCEHKSSWEKSEYCEEELRSIEYKVPPKK